MRLVFDLEADGLLDEVTKIHCIVAQDVDTGEIFEFYNYLKDDTPPASDRCHGGLVTGMAFLATADELIGHNIQGYDIPVLAKVLGWSPSPETKITDTLVMARVHRPDIGALDKADPECPKTVFGRHSLDAWGYRVGERKAEYDGGWEKLTQEMLDYCVQDVRANTKVFLHLESLGLSEQALALEHAFADECRQVMDRGWRFDTEAALELQRDLEVRQAEIQDELVGMFPGWEIEYETPKTKQKRTKFKPFNPGSRQQLAQLFQERHGWKPKVFTDSGQPKVDEKVLEALDFPEAQLAAENLMIGKILGMVATGKAAWLEQVKDGRIFGFINHCGANTSRCTHRAPNLAQVPSSGVYGKRCRSLFLGAEGGCLVGGDASGIELRMLAHYMFPYDNGNLIDVVLNGDIHQTNFEALKWCPKINERRDAKAPIYAMLYGAGDMKLGEFGGGGYQMGKKMRAALYQAIPGFRKLTEAVKAAYNDSGSLKALDGRRLYPRGENSALNTLLQGAGAVVMKQAVVLAGPLVRRNRGHLVGLIHDEMQAESSNDRAQEIGACIKESIVEAGEILGVRCPLDGEYMSGPNWTHTH